LVSGRVLVLFLPCDWRFLPKLGPHLGAALFLYRSLLVADKN
jgi:hypothetical protein